MMKAARTVCCARGMMRCFAVVCRLPLRRADDSEPQVLILQTSSRKAATLLALLASALYAVNIPLSKLLLNHVQPMMAAYQLYIGRKYIVKE